MGVYFYNLGVYFAIDLFFMETASEKLIHSPEKPHFNYGAKKVAE